MIIRQWALLFAAVSVAVLFPAPTGVSRPINDTESMDAVARAVVETTRLLEGGRVPSATD